MRGLKSVVVDIIKGPIFILGSSYRETLNIALLELQEEGVVSSLENKWWKNQGKTQKCDLMGKLLSSFSDIF